MKVERIEKSATHLCFMIDLKIIKFLSFGNATIHLLEMI